MRVPPVLSVVLRGKCTQQQLETCSVLSQHAEIKHKRLYFIFSSSTFAIFTFTGGPLYEISLTFFHLCHYC